MHLWTPVHAFVGRPYPYPRVLALGGNFIMTRTVCEDTAASYGTAQSTSLMLVSCSQPFFLLCFHFQVMLALMVMVYSQCVQVSYSAMCDSATRRNNELSSGS